MRRKWFILLLACLPLSGFAQEAASIAGRAVWLQEMKGMDGKVLMTFDMPVPSLQAVLVTETDTLRISGDGTGHFRFKDLAAGPVHLSLEAKGYLPFSERFELVPGENVVLVEMKRESQEKTETVEEIDPAKVEADIPVMSFNGDTLVYNAAALALQQGDYAIDLLRQMPGVEVKNRQITVSGKAVRRTYVNGALIFGLDPMAGMENLTGEQVTQFYVYDQENPQDRLDGLQREKDRVIDIRTKDPLFSVTDLQTRLLAGADLQKREDGSLQGRYALGVNGKYFSELRQLRTDVTVNNLGMGTSSINADPQVQSRYTENLSASLAYERFWESPLYGNGIQAEYSFTHNRTKSWNRALTEYFETAGVPARTVESRHESEQGQAVHSLATTASYRTNPSFHVTWRSNLSFSREEGNGLDLGSTIISGGMPMGKNEKTYSGNSSWNVNENLTLGFRAGKFRPNIQLGAQIGRDNTDSWALDTLASSYAQRHLTRNGNGLQQHYQASVSHYFFPLSGEKQHLSLTASYNLSYQNSSRIQQAFDLFGTPEPLENAANTFDYTYSVLQNRLDVSGNYILRLKKTLLVTFGLGLAAHRVLDRERIPASLPTGKTYYSLLPSLSLSYGSSLMLRYSSSASLPSVQQIRQRVDDTEPLLLQAGNPNLRQSQTHQVSFRLGQPSFTQGQRYISYFSLSANLTTAPVISRTDVFTSERELSGYNYTVPAGATLLTWENADFALSSSLTYTWSGQLSLFHGRWKPTLNVRPTLSYSLQPAYFGTILDRSSELTPELSLQASWRLGSWLSLRLEANPAYIHVRSSTGKMDMEAFRSALGGEVSIHFLKNGIFQTSYNWTVSRNLTRSSLDTDIHRLNASVGVNLLKGRMRLSLMGLDLLRGGSFYAASFGPSCYSQRWTPVYGRCFLVSVSWRFNSSGGQKLFPTVTL